MTGSHVNNGYSREPLCFCLGSLQPLPAPPEPPVRVSHNRQRLATVIDPSYCAHHLDNCPRLLDFYLRSASQERFNGTATMQYMEDSVPHAPPVSALLVNMPKGIGWKHSHLRADMGFRSHSTIRGIGKTPHIRVALVKISHEVPSLPTNPREPREDDYPVVHCPHPARLPLAQSTATTRDRTRAFSAASSLNTMVSVGMSRFGEGSQMDT